MWARRLSNRLMMAGPLIYLSAISLNGYAGAPADDSPVFGAEANRRLLEYSEPLRQVAVLRSAPPERAAEATWACSRVWIKKADEGRLETVMPVDAESQSGASVLSEIRDAKVDITSSLRILAREAESSGNSKGAVNALVFALRIEAVNKYSDLGSVHQFGTSQILALEQIMRLSSHLSAGERAWVAAQLTASKAGESKLATIVSRVRTIHAVSLERRGLTPNKLEFSEGYGALAEAVTVGEPNASEILRKISSNRHFTPELIGLSSVARLATRTDTAYQAALSKAINQLQSAK